MHIILEIKYPMLCPFIIIILHGQIKGTVSSVSVTQTNFNGAFSDAKLVGGKESKFPLEQLFQIPGNERSALRLMLKGQVGRNPF